MSADQDQTEPPEPKPCPFCGEPPIHQDVYLAHIMGHEPGLLCPRGHTMAMTLSEWNERV